MSALQESGGIQFFNRTQRRKITRFLKKYNFHADNIYVIDYEFKPDGNGNPRVVCLVVYELLSGNVYRYWSCELYQMTSPPFKIGDNDITIAYFASAEMGCHLALNWPFPANLIDLYVEFSNITNGLERPHGKGLIGALQYFGIISMENCEKKDMRDLILHTEEHSHLERKMILDYCEVDVISTAKLFLAMLEYIDLYRSMHRGNYMKSSSIMEYNGVPVDAEMLNLFLCHRDTIKLELIEKVDREYGVYQEGVFKTNKFLEYLVAHGYEWPFTMSGIPKLDDNTFKEMVKTYPQLNDLRQLRSMLSSLQSISIFIGNDGRSRTILSPFASKSSRNQPSNSKFIFGMAKIFRCFLKPSFGTALAYPDYCQQEFGIAAAFSGDQNMMDAYKDSDPYLWFAIKAGQAPLNATKDSHKEIRKKFKATSLGVLFCMEAHGLARRLGIHYYEAKELIAMHKSVFKQFWKWSENNLNRALLTRKLETVFGWNIHVPNEDYNPRTYRNFPMQGNGAEMLRLACQYIIESGVKLCAPIHDAVLIEAPINEIDDVIAKTQKAMLKASKVILDGFELKTDVEVIRYPDRYIPEGAEEIWSFVEEKLIHLQGVKNV
ncbi:MAG: DNA polymerase I [Planctomycetes bacterium]|nr:DNA polymerase I [Planctomycetota bacterium]